MRARLRFEAINPQMETRKETQAKAWICAHPPSPLHQTLRQTWAPPVLCNDETYAPEVCYQTS